jgi:hypothetical protein
MNAKGRDVMSRGGGTSGALVAVKAAHTFVWAGVESCMVYLLYAGWMHRSDRRAAVAAGVVAAEMAVFAGCGFRCPLTGVAERLGADDGSVTDIFLPRPVARALPAIHVPLVVLAVALHVRNIRQRQQSWSASPPSRKPVSVGTFGPGPRDRRNPSVRS